MDPTTVPKPPRHLAAPGRAFWRQVLADYQLDAGGLALLAQACECLDRIAQARALIAEEGLVTGSQRGGGRVHPAAQLERDNRTLFLRALHQLNLAPTEI